MREDSALPPAPAPIPAFAPVPVRVRRDGWTEERQRVFIAALARTGCVGRAARSAGMSRESAYRLRRRTGAEGFAEAWDRILAARPPGSSSLALIWHRIVRKAGGPGAVQCVAAPSDREAVRPPDAGCTGRARGRSQ